MRKPIIGIIGKLEPQYGDDLWHRIDEVDELRYFIVKNGGIAITLLPTEKDIEFNDDSNYEKSLTDEELHDLYQEIDLCDAFILQGGLISKKYEIAIAKRIIELDKPLIGICAGFNNILRAIGSKVIKDETNSHNHYDKEYRHRIIIEPNTIMYELVKKDEYYVNSIHAMVARKEDVYPYARISSYSEDDLVESFELPNKKFIVGIKWHPELMNPEFIDKLFKTFISKCN